MQTARRKKILELIGEQIINTQQGLTEALKVSGFEVGQATVSRDIRELGLSKLYVDGSYRYVAPESSDAPSAAVLRSIFLSGVTSVEAAQNLVIVLTLPGLAPAAMSAVDAMRETGVLGTLAGDDTGLIVLRDAEAATTLAELLRNLGE